MVRQSESLRRWRSRGVSLYQVTFADGRRDASKRSLARRLDRCQRRCRVLVDDGGRADDAHQSRSRGRLQLRLRRLTLLTNCGLPVIAVRFMLLMVVLVPTYARDSSAVD